jgi:hypothetical protein
MYQVNGPLMNVIHNIPDVLASRAAGKIALNTANQTLYPMYDLLRAGLRDELQNELKERKRA